MAKGGLTLVIPSTEIKLSSQENVEVLIRKAKVMAFIRGSIEFPQDPDTKKFAGIIKKLKFKNEKDFESFDIDNDFEIEMSLVKYSNLTIIPQLYIKGLLIGGVDIVDLLNDTGEL